MNHCSYFIENKALFGSYPTQESVDELEREGVKYFVNLTFNTEKKIVPYNTNFTYITYPIEDRYVPPDLISFCKFIIDIAKIIRSLKHHDKLLIHCRGGHSRSTFVCACLICYMFNKNPYDALHYIKQFHNNRSVLREKWKKAQLLSYVQKKFVYKFCNPIHFTRICKSISLADIFVKDLQKYVESKEDSEGSEDSTITIEDAFKEYKRLYEENPENDIFKRFKRREHWEHLKEQILRYLLVLRFEQNDIAKNNLISSYLRPIMINHMDHDMFWHRNGIELEQVQNIIHNIRIKYIQEI